MPHQNVWVWKQINALRRSKKKPELTWKEFIEKEPKAIHREKIKLLDEVTPDEKKIIIRPAAQYDNKSPYDKYEI